jgi:hypothetical protein
MFALDQVDLRPVSRESVFHREGTHGRCIYLFMVDVDANGRHETHFV